MMDVRLLILRLVDHRCIARRRRHQVSWYLFPVHAAPRLLLLLLLSLQSSPFPLTSTRHRLSIIMERKHRLPPRLTISTRGNSDTNKGNTCIPCDRPRCSLGIRRTTFPSLLLVRDVVHRVVEYRRADTQVLHPFRVEDVVGL